MPRPSLLAMSALLLGSLALLATGACTRTPRPTPAVALQAARLDSVVLERTRCFGTCPAYRLHIGRGGAVHFRSTSGTEPAVADDTIAAWALDSLHAHAVRARLWELPTRIEGSELCAAHATDHPTVMVTLYGRVPKHVSYYTGCYLAPGAPAPSLVALRQFADHVDALAQSHRWVRTPPRR